MTKLLLGLSLAAFVAVSPPSALAAQHAPEPGRRVRVELLGGRVLTGHVEAIDRDSLLLRPGRDSIAASLPRHEVIAFRTSLGRDHAAGARRGFKLGALVGGGLALVALGSAAVYDLRGGGRDDWYPASLAVGILGAGFTIGSTLVGGALGGLIGREQWGPRISVGVRVGP